jgi:hypothetical protein
MEITGSGNDGGSSKIGKSSSQSVSPVVMFLIPTIAAISPEKQVSMSSRLSA